MSEPSDSAGVPIVTQSLDAEVLLHRVDWRIWPSSSDLMDLSFSS